MVENDTTVQNLLAEALNDLFAKYGKPEIAPTVRTGELNWLTTDLKHGPFV